VICTGSILEFYCPCDCPVSQLHDSLYHCHRQLCTTTTCGDSLNIALYIKKRGSISMVRNELQIWRPFKISAQICNSFFTKTIGVSPLWCPSLRFQRPEEYLWVDYNKLNCQTHNFVSYYKVLWRAFSWPDSLSSNSDRRSDTRAKWLSDSDASTQNFLYHTTRCNGVHFPDPIHCRRIHYRRSDTRAKWICFVHICNS
jgi:hypothetical protein